MLKSNRNKEKDEMDIKSVILAAGKGTRMKSQTPKVLHKSSAKLFWVMFWITLRI